MKNKKFLKIIILLLIFLIIGLFINNNVFGSWVDTQLTDIEGKATTAGNAGNKVTSIMGAAVNIVSTVAAGVAIIMLIFLGIEYTSKGAQGKADAKKDVTGYVIGAVLLFGASGILKLIQMFIEANVN